MGRKEKLSPQYIGPFEILERIGRVACRLNLPQELSSVHNVIHMVNLKKCLAEESVIISLEKLQINKQLHFN